MGESRSSYRNISRMSRLRTYLFGCSLCCGLYPQRRAESFGNSKEISWEFFCCGQVGSAMPLDSWFYIMRPVQRRWKSFCERAKLRKRKSRKKDSLFKSSNNVLVTRKKDSLFKSSNNVLVTCRF